jgi:hypothetical protein
LTRQSSFFKDVFFLMDARSSPGMTLKIIAQEITIKSCGHSFPNGRSPSCFKPYFLL